jgi:hypothetical protein
MWIVSGPMSSVPVCGDGIEANIGATFCPAASTPAFEASDENV